uniref:Uncharacterized protein n=1 Tax=Strongyloides papillosus TaxID=174720 RepID=A0A0N5C6C1_STREA
MKNCTHFYLGNNEIGNEIDITTKRRTTKSPSSNLDTNKIEDYIHRNLEDERRKTIKHNNRRKKKVCIKTIDKERGYNYKLINATVHSVFTESNNDIEAHLEFFLLWKSNNHTQQLCTEKITENIVSTKDALFEKEENASINSLPKGLKIKSKRNSKNNEQYISSPSLTSQQTVSSSAHLFDDNDDIESSRNSTLKNHIDFYTKHLLL